MDYLTKLSSEQFLILMKCNTILINNKNATQIPGSIFIFSHHLITY